MTGGVPLAKTTAYPAARTGITEGTPYDIPSHTDRKPLHDAHIALITTSFPLRQGATSAPFVQKLVDHLARCTTVTVVTPADSLHPQAATPPDYRLCAFRYAPRHWQILAQTPGGIPVALKKRPLLYLLLPGMLVSMFVSILRLAPNATLIHANWSAVGLIAGLAGKIIGTPVVTTLRGSDLRRLDSSLLSRLILRICLRLNDKVVCVSHHFMEQISRHYPWAKPRLSVIPNGVDDRILNIPPKTPANPGVLRLVCVGSLISRKNIDTIIRAVAISTDIPVQLTIVGDGPERLALHSLAESLGIGDSIRFLGEQTPDVIPQILAANDIFIIASKFEGRSNALLEAMGAGLAIIGSDIPGVREVIRDHDNGLLFSARDVTALATALRRLWNDPLLRITLGTNARATILDNGLTWKRCADQYIQLYAKVLAQHRSTS